jgi:hypothetical protein
MSRFRVKLNNGTQGLLDINPSTASIQRSIYVSGPNRIYRELKDGEEFEDSNYWKRYAYPNCSLEVSFLEIIEDDGSVWSDYTLNNNAPKAYTLNLDPNSEFSDNMLDIENQENGFATFVQISNGNGDIKVRLNASDTAVFSIKSNETQIFSQGELNLNKIEFKNENEEPVNVQVITSIKVNYKT